MRSDQRAIPGTYAPRFEQETVAARVMSLAASAASCKKRRAFMSTRRSTIAVSGATDGWVFERCGQGNIAWRQAPDGSRLIDIVASRFGCARFHWAQPSLAPRNDHGAQMQHSAVDFASCTSFGMA